MKKHVMLVLLGLMVGLLAVGCGKKEEEASAEAAEEFSTEEEIVEEDGSVSMEYTIDFTGKSSQEIQVITDYLKYVEYLAKLDGKLPTVMGDESATVLIPTPSEN